MQAMLYSVGADDESEWETALLQVPADTEKLAVTVGYGSGLAIVSLPC
jgi:hypothetical protein